MSGGYPYLVCKKKISGLNVSVTFSKPCWSLLKTSHQCLLPVGHLTRKSGVLGSILGLATFFRFSFRFFKKGSCQLLAKVCARSTG